MILVADFVDRPEEIVETEIVGTPGGAAGSPEFAAHVSERVRYGIDRFLPLGARPVEDGDAFRPRTASDIARPQYVHSTLTPGFGRCAEIAVMSGRIWTPPDCKRVWQTLVQGSQLRTYIRLPYAA